MEADKESVRDICRELRRKAETEKGKKKVDHFKSYLTTNWEGICHIRRKEAGEVIQKVM